nr:MaoC family dehydratase [Phenylobacterium aquaticum]
MFFEDLQVGQSAEMTRSVTEADIQAFAAVSGDTNPVHLDEAYAQTTSFQGRIAHGMLSAAYISAVIGTQLPGPGAIYLSQSLKFRRPVRIGATVVTTVTIEALDERRGHATFATVCQVDGKSVVEGEALIMVPRKTVGGA